ncbi:MAG: ribonuclease III [Ilumatobacteraceae bacterium]
MNDPLHALASRIGHEFKDESLLEVAMAHRSWIAENDGHESNERLEFLGDAVLGWVVADIVYRLHSELPEGKLTDLRKSVVNAISLAQVANDFEIGECLKLGRGEDAAGGREKTSILSDALESVIGAVYLDAGAVVAYEVVGKLMGESIEHAIENLDRIDAKTRLQEMTARLFDVAPHYRITDDGPDHEKTFYATVVVNGRDLGHGEGRSKKAAEQVAAEIACDALQREHG